MSPKGGFSRPWRPTWRRSKENASTSRAAISLNSVTAHTHSYAHTHAAVDTCTVSKAACCSHKPTLALFDFRGLIAAHMYTHAFLLLHSSYRLHWLSHWASWWQQHFRLCSSLVLNSCILPSVAAGLGQSFMLPTQLELQDPEDSQAQPRSRGHTQTHSSSSYHGHMWRWRGSAVLLGIWTQKSWD